MKTETSTTRPLAQGARAPGREKRTDPRLAPGTRFVLDAILLNTAFFSAYWLRYRLDIGGQVAGENFLGIEAYLPIQAGLAVSLLAVYTATGLYRRNARTSLLEEASAILSATSFGMMLFLAMVFLFRGLAYSRGLFLMAWALMIGMVVVFRACEQMLMAYRRARGIGVKRVVVIGDGQLARAVMHVIATEPGLGYQLVGFLVNGEDSNGDVGRFRRLGSIQDLASVLRSHGIDEAIVALPSYPRDLFSQMMETCQEDGVAFKIVPDLYELSLSRLDVDELRGIPVIGAKEVSIQGVNLVIKRIVDLTAAGTMMALLSPFWLLLALLIKLDSPGPVYFRQTRLGKGGKPFTALKFRSMKNDAEAELSLLMDKNEAMGPIFKIRRDPRVTRVGRFLRRTSLDELPQLINVLRGEMSLVGPRPPLPSEVEKYEPWHLKRLDAAPGLTGLWQVSGRSELPFDEMVMLDIYYIENWSLGQDIQILLRTVPAVVTGRGAY